MAWLVHRRGLGPVGGRSAFLGSDAMRGPRRPEDLPRLLAALGLSDDEPSRSGPPSPEAEARLQAGLDFWLPTAESLAATRGPAHGSPPVRREPQPVIRAPEALQGGRVAVPVRTAVVVLLIVLLALVVFAARVLLARADGHPVPVLTGSAATSTAGVLARASPTFAAGGTTASAPVGTAAGSGQGARQAVVVDIVGQVRHPGVYTLSAGERVGDAVRAAGGVVTPSDVSVVNLARVLVDGEQIRVPKPGEAVTAAPLAGGPAASGGVVNLNTADTGTLDGLPGVGPVLAQRIVDWRAAHGRFSSVDELGEVSGIGEKLLGQLRSKVAVS